MVYRHRGCADVCSPNATDCHHHVYDKRFPLAPSATLTPGDATVADYRDLQKRIGTTCHVVVQPSTYGTDNRLLVEALGQFGSEARGIAVVDTNVSDAELKALNAAGVKGIRFNLVQNDAHRGDDRACTAGRAARLARPNPYARRRHCRD